MVKTPYSSHYYLTLFCFIAFIEMKIIIHYRFTQKGKDRYLGFPAFSDDCSKRKIYCSITCDYCQLNGRNQSFAINFDLACAAAPADIPDLISLL